MSFGNSKSTSQKIGSIGELKKESLLDSDIKDPQTGKYFSDDIVIELKAVVV